MPIAATLTFLVLVAILGALVTSRYAPELVLLFGLSVLLICGVIEPNLAFSGFSNPAVVALAGLYILSGALRHSGALEWVADRLLRGVDDTGRARLRLMAVVTPLSAFLNNTPLVALLIPMAKSWARQQGISARALLMPLSFAAILGGTCTLVGTSSHLVTHGLLLERGMPGLGFFELLPVGIGILAIGIPSIIFMSSRILGAEPGAAIEPLDAVRAYTTDLVIQSDSPLIGRTVEEARLRSLKGLFLVRIVRSERVISPVGPGEPLVVGDRLTFAGVLETIVELSGRRGLVPAEVDKMPAGWHLHEAVISRSSPLIGRSIKAANFRARYGAAVIAVHRHGGRINQKLGDIVLRHGDTVLIQTSQGFARTFRDAPDFYLISEVKDAERHDPRKALLSLIVFLAAMASVVIGGLPIVTAAVAGAACSILCGCISINAARRAVDGSVLVVMAAAIGLGQAAEVSGLSGYVIQLLTGLSGSVTPFFMLLLIYLVGMLFTEFVSNVAAAAILFPICLGVASAMGVDARPFVVAVTISTAISLTTPLGYQTNMMVYGPGEYAFGDFVRVGLPVQLACASTALCVIAYIHDIPIAF